MRTCAGVPVLSRTIVSRYKEKYMTWGSLLTKGRSQWKCIALENAGSAPHRCCATPKRFDALRSRAWKMRLPFLQTA
jgi:hypothetical protein